MNRCQICGGPLEWCKCPTPMSALLGPATERAINVQESTQVVATAAAVGDYDAPMFGPDRLVRHKKFDVANKFVRTWRHTSHGRTRLVVEVEDATGEKLQWWADDCEPLCDCHLHEKQVCDICQGCQGQSDRDVEPGSEVTDDVVESMLRSFANMTSEEQARFFLKEFLKRGRELERAEKERDHCKAMFQRLGQFRKNVWTVHEAYMLGKDYTAPSPLER